MQGKPGETIANVFAAFRGALEQQNKTPARHKGIFTTLQQCRTPTLGGHVEACPNCGHIQTGWNPVRTGSKSALSNLQQHKAGAMDFGPSI